MAAIIAPPDTQLREDFKAFVCSRAETWYREHLARLYTLWDGWNAAYFNGQLIVPYVLLTPPDSPKALGDCSNISSFGGRCQIRIRPTLLTGEYKHLRAGKEYAEGRFLFVTDVLLHESIHQWHFEITGQTEDSYHGHGPVFATMCNQIGATLGLAPVRSMKKRGKDKELPSCAHWPHNVRPLDYYLGAFKGHEQAGEQDGDSEQDGDGEQDSASGRNPLADLLDQVIADLDANRIAQARRVLVELRRQVPT